MDFSRGKAFRREGTPSTKTVKILGQRIYSDSKSACRVRMLCGNDLSKTEQLCITDYFDPHFTHNYMGEAANVTEDKGEG